MKQHTYMKVLPFSILLFCFSACSNETEDIRNSDNAIQFIAEYNPLAARSIIQQTGTGCSALTSGFIHVYAQADGESSWYINDDLALASYPTWDWNTSPKFPFFATLTGNGTTDANFLYEGTYGKVYMWPAEDVTFYSYYVKEAADRTYIKQDGETAFDATSDETKFIYTLAANPVDQCDFLMINPQTQSAGGVRFEFHHTMAMLRFDYISENQVDDETSITKIEFPSPSQGSIDVASGTVAMTADASSALTNISYNPNLAVRHVDVVSSNTSHIFPETTSSLIFPGDADIPVKVTIHSADASIADEVKDITLPAVSGGFLAGHVYQFTLVSTVDYIEVCDPVVLTDWVIVEDTDNTGDVDVL